MKYSNKNYLTMDTSAQFMKQLNEANHNNINFMYLFFMLKNLVIVHHS